MSTGPHALAAGLIAVLLGSMPSAALAAAKAEYRFTAAPGERVDSVAVVDTDGRRMPLLEAAGPSGLVLVVRDAECPVSQRYAPLVRAMSRDSRFAGYAFAYVDVTPHDGDAAQRDAAAQGVRTLADRGGELAGLLRAETTAIAYLIDANGTLQYRGAIDDQYGIEHQRARATHAWLAEALLALDRGEAPAVRRTPGVGCTLAARGKAAALSRPVTYHDRVSRIIQDRCEACHRAGGLAPMPLQDFEQVHARRAVIRLMVASGRMPPWSAHPAVGKWANDRSLGAAEKRDLLAWIDSGAPAGDPAHAPRPRSYDPGWKIGKPDAVIPIPQPIRVPASGIVAYQYVYAKTDFPTDRWVTALEIRPSEPRVVHHVIVLLEEPGRRHLTPEERARFPAGQAPPEPGDTAAGFFGITVPGSLGMSFPPGTGKKLPRGAWLKFEIHYQPNGVEVHDRTEIGLRFADAPVREVESRSAADASFVIPPRAAAHRVQASHRFTQPGVLLSLFPHMHLRGKAFRYELVDAKGKARRLLEVPRFDFNWQSYYQFAEPVAVTPGARLVATAWYDNSAANPWNPDPRQEVRWGPLTTDEMMIGYFEFIPERPAPAPRE
jgi:hypothetical protein